jgi:hypothetical protein
VSRGLVILWECLRNWDADYCTQDVVAGSSREKVQLMYQMVESHNVHNASAIIAFFTPQESARYGYQYAGPY